jgi:PPK2 family polyphosphate:nucleotide phosphotransferase
MNIEPKQFRIQEEGKVDLEAMPTRVEPFFKSKKDFAEILAQHIGALSVRQNLLFASNRHAVLLIVQAMDTAGKDGIIKHVMTGINPQGCHVFSFKQPSLEELQHDFLWRTTCRLPERGQIGIFNRSYYEEVLVVRVHPNLLQGEGIPESRGDKDTFWADRFKSIRDLEAHLHRNGTIVIKIFLHLSKDEQRTRLLERIETPEKNWKFSAADIKERERWGAYRKAYEAVLGATSTQESPWYVVPADSKKNARLIVSQIILDRLDQLHLAYPESSKARDEELAAIGKDL